ncbi:GLPGLI family protein [Pedobacter jamesrossensis]|uniref:GLPGLI family protein n=1 Tax=Pedobacter jamesrossensis TaxID=1908238 RepID=A0ABV8NG66_9SPHI
MITLQRSFYIFLIFTIVSKIAAHAQQSNLALAKAFYKFSYINDTTKRDQPVNKTMVLYMNKDASLFRNLMDEESKLLLYLSKGGSKSKFDILEESASLIQIADKTQRVERLIDNMYVISEGQKTIDWKLQDETKKIGNYLAQKATAEISGRYYTVWFTQEIPFQFGPWKLKGLPGLILDARDSRGEVIFEFDGFEMMKKEELVKISVPKSFKIKKVSFGEFEKIYKSFYDDPITFSKASLGITDSKKVINGNPSSSERKYNNPIEIRR